MGPMYYIGLDVHKQKISYCVKDVGGPSPPRKRKTTASTPTRFATVCAVIFCRNATWPRPPSANDDARCAIASRRNILNSFRDKWWGWGGSNSRPKV
jgi:hypothetical protein